MSKFLKKEWASLVFVTLMLIICLAGRCSEQYTTSGKEIIEYDFMTGFGNPECYHEYYFTLEDNGGVSYKLKEFIVSLDGKTSKSKIIDKGRLRSIENVYELEGINRSTKFYLYYTGGKEIKLID